MNDAKWESLRKVMQFQRDNFDILKNASFIGGNPEEGNVYGFVSWSEEGEGIVALRNPSQEEAPLTLTLNKLMGAPETLENARIESVYCKAAIDSAETYSYNEKLNLTLDAYETIILKFTK